MTSSRSICHVKASIFRGHVDAASQLGWRGVNLQLKVLLAQTPVAGPSTTPLHLTALKGFGRRNGGE